MTTTIAARGRQQLARRITDTQRRLLAPGAVATERRALLDQLELLELERGESGDGDVPAADAGTLSFASLEAVQRALHPREAMLWFSIGAWKDLYDDFGGGAWVVVVTRDGVRLHRLATPVALDSQVAALTGLLRQRETPDGGLDGGRAVPWAHVAGAAPLPICPRTSSVSTIVSDGVLHRLPFEVASLTATHRRRWASGSRSPSFRRPRSGSACEDPAVDRRQAPRWFLPILKCRAELQSAMRRSSPCPGRAGKRPQSLASCIWTPHAVHQGSAASERVAERRRRWRIRRACTLRRTRVPMEPSRNVRRCSSLPVAADEDGWLQPREIAALNLSGSLVVLSACESADGALLSGEGPAEPRARLLCRRGERRRRHALAAAR